VNRDHREGRTELLDALKDVRIQFWTCPNEDHKHVTWTGDVAACDTCGMTSEMTGRLIRAAAAYERERLYAELGNDHFVTFIHGRWAIEHSVECRLSGRMSECAYHQAVATVADDCLADWGGGTLGRWKITGISEGLPDLERAEPQP
jgi:hypothetical protein